MSDWRDDDEIELAFTLFRRMLSGRPVWVDSQAGQRTYVDMIGLDDDRHVVVYDRDGQDRLAEDYLLDNPGRRSSNAES